jgi:hypothetical protein
MPAPQMTPVAVIGSIVLLLIILELIRRRYLRERYAILWIVTGAIFFVFSIRVKWLHTTSNFLGFSVPSNALFFLGILFLVLVSLSLSVITSRLSEKNRVLTQEIVLLKKRVADLENSHGVTKEHNTRIAGPQR